MKISAKSRYGLAALICMAEKYEKKDNVAVITLSERLNISKIYLEQVFSLLKRGGILTSTKGAQGGYQLARPAEEITIYDVLSAIELAVFEKTEPTVAESDEAIEKAMQHVVFDAVDTALNETLTNISLEDIVNQTKTYKSDDNYMYYL